MGNWVQGKHTICYTITPAPRVLGYLSAENVRATSVELALFSGSVVLKLPSLGSDTLGSDLLKKELTLQSLPSSCFGQDTKHKKRVLMDDEIHHGGFFST